MVTGKKNKQNLRDIKVNKRKYFGILTIGLCGVSILLYTVIWPMFPEISKKDMLCVFVLMWLILSHISIRCSQK